MKDCINTIVDKSYRVSFVNCDNLSFTIEFTNETAALDVKTFGFLDHESDEAGHIPIIRDILLSVIEDLSVFNN